MQVALFTEIYQNDTYWLLLSDVRDSDFWNVILKFSPFRIIK